MIAKNILVLATYPIAQAQHGGQKRTAAIVDLYRRTFKTVTFCAIYHRGFYPVAGPDDIAVGRKTDELISWNPYTSDIICGDALMDDPFVHERLRALIAGRRPNIIHVEQPFLYLGLQPLLKSIGYSGKIVFGSQNIEAPMKREILEGAGVDKASIDQVVKRIDDVEHDFSRAADLVIAVSPDDVAAHRRMGAKEVVLAANGINLDAPTPDALAYWRRRFDDEAINHTVLFVGSAHPPNWVGFETMVGKSLGFLPHDTRLVLAGSISDYFSSQYVHEELDEATFWLRAIATGRISDSSLAALLHLADVIILPITEGGGSNLKTAEAIAADKKVVATPHALRSYEAYADLPNIWTADAADSFRAAIINALKVKKIVRSDHESLRAQNVLWPKALESIANKVGAL